MDALRRRAVASSATVLMDSNRSDRDTVSLLTVLLEPVWDLVWIYHMLQVL